jgi:exonuclease III
MSGERHDAPAAPAARVITWNVARRSSRLAEQALALARREPDVVALQEVTTQTLALWRAALATIGLGHVAASLDAADPQRRPAGPRRTGVLLAARGPLKRPRVELAPPWAETAIGRTADTPVGRVDVHCVHVPNAANGRVKVDTLRAIRRDLGDVGNAPVVLVGDLNTPRRETPTGEVLSFARDSRGRLRRDRGPEWDEAELGVVPGLREIGFRDAFRTLHGYSDREPSWTWRRIAGHDGGWRIDHAFASRALRAVACRYHHEWRDGDLSDHSALEVDLAPA